MKKRTPTSGQFWVIEGPDGSGKTTQLQKLKIHLIDKGLDVQIAREPGGTKWGMEIRKLFLAGQGELVPMAEVMLLLAAKAQLFHEVILPAYNQGKYVLMDRHTDSLLAYQGGGRQLGFRKLQETIRAAELNFPPTFTIFLSTPYEVCLERMRQRPTAENNVMDEFDETHQRRIHQAYRDIVLMGRAAGRPLAVVDGTQSAEEIHESILDHLELKESNITMRD